MTQRFDVLTIGNAIVDVLAQKDDAFLVAEGLDKSIMHLIDEKRAEQLYNHLGDAQEISGGSAGNTAAGVASLGGQAAFIGKVADDELGKVFAADMRNAGVYFETPPLVGGEATARSMIIITPDSERTMNTYLGACQQLSEKDIDADVVSSAAVTYMEGYLWDPLEAKKAFLKAAQIAHASERAAAISLSDAFCVDRYREEFLDLMRSKSIDYLFANIDELKSLYQTDSMQEAVLQVSKDVELAAVTMGKDGAMGIFEGEVITVPAYPVADLTDLTGAGDLFASGFLTAHAKGAALKPCLQLGCLAASEVIGHVGARPETNLQSLAKLDGLDFC